MADPITTIVAAIGGTIAFIQSLVQEPISRYFVIAFFSIGVNIAEGISGVYILDYLILFPINLFLTILGVDFTFGFPVINGISSLTILIITYPIWTWFFYDIFSR